MLLVYYNILVKSILDFLPNNKDKLKIIRQFYT